MGPVAVTFSSWPEEILPWSNSVLRRITTCSIRARKDRDGKAVRRRVAEVDQLRKDFCRIPQSCSFPGLVTLASQKSVVGGVELKIPGLEVKKSNKDWRFTLRQVAHGPYVSPLDTESQASGHCDIVPPCQGARIQVTLQTPELFLLCEESQLWPALLFLFLG